MGKIIVERLTADEFCDRAGAFLYIPQVRAWVTLHTPARVHVRIADATLHYQIDFSLQQLRQLDLQTEEDIDVRGDRWIELNDEIDVAELRIEVRSACSRTEHVQPRDVESPAEVCTPGYAARLNRSARVSQRTSITTGERLESSLRQ